MKELSLKKRRAKRSQLQEHETEEQVRRRGIINRMTNWQNTQWMRAGMPKRMSELETFASMVKKCAANVVELKE